MTPIVIKKPRAKRDLLDLYTYIGDRNSRAADHFLREMEKAFSLLATFPPMGAAWESNSPRLAGVRYWTISRFRNYVIFYRPIENGIEVLHVFHASRNVRRLLEEEPDE